MEVSKTLTPAPPNPRHLCRYLQGRCRHRWLVGPTIRLHQRQELACMVRVQQRGAQRVQQPREMVGQRGLGADALKQVLANVSRLFLERAGHQERVQG